MNESAITPARLQGPTVPKPFFASAHQIAEWKRKAEHAQRLADALKDVTEELAAGVDNWKNGCETGMSTKAWNECANLVVEAREAIAQWEKDNQ